MRKLKYFALSLVSVSVLAVAFNNCSKNFTANPSFGSGNDVTESSSQSPDGSNNPSPNGGVGINDPSNLGADLCEKQIRSAFSGGYHVFFKNTCVTCHSSGPGKGTFANANLEVAYTSFSQMGYIALTDKAKSNHQPQYTGPQNANTVNELKSLWDTTLAEYATCKGTTNIPVVEKPEDKVAFQTIYKSIPMMNTDEEKTVTWTMSSEIQAIKDGFTMPALGGAQLIVTVSRKVTSGGQTYYLITRPQIKNSSADVQVKAMSVYMNGDFLKYPTTFAFVDATVRKNTTDNAAATFSTGSMASPGVFSTNDQIALGFELIKDTVLPPPPPPMTIQFDGAKVRSVVKGVSFVDIDVSLSRAAESLVTVNVTELGNKLCNENISIENSNSKSVKLNENATCYPEVKAAICPTNDASCLEKLNVYRARSVVGSSYNRYDWDFKLENTSFVYFPGESKKTFRVYFSQDIRKEGTRLLTLQLSIGTSGVSAGAISEVHYIFDKLVNPDPPFGVATFTELMNPMSGILGTRCLECHNSTKLEGGYDMSNYALMIQKGVLIPNDPNSKMYMRMNPNNNQQNLRPMPLNGFLETQLTREVERWILNGALNN